MKKWILIIVLLAASSAVAQNKEKGFFISYELLEMAANKFQYFAGDLGYRFDQKNQTRFLIMEVKLTEEHLSSDWAKIVDGNNVKG